MAAEVSVPTETGINSKHLDNLLSSDELSVIPKQTVDKIESYIDVKFEEFLTSKALYEAGRKTSVERIEKLENESRDVGLQYEHCKAKLEASEQTLREFETQLTMTKSELTKCQESLKRQEYDAEDFRRQRDSAFDERDSLMNLVERRNTEMEHLKTDLSGVSSQLQTAINAKCEALSKNDEVHSKELSLKYKEQRIDQERTLLNGQIQSLTQELDRCTSELQTIRLNNTSRILSLETQLAEKTEELSLAAESINTLNEAKKSLILKADTLNQKLMDQKEMERKMNENFQMELDAKTKLTDLYSSMRVDTDSKNEEMTNAIIELQNMISETTAKYGQLETEKKQKEADHEELIEKKNEAINLLKRELENANDLLQAAKNDSLNVLLEDLSPSAAITSKLIKSGMSLTQIYTQLVQVTDELMKEKEENKQLTLTMNNIVIELEERAPLMKQQNDQYAEALENNAALRQQLDSLIMECNQLRDDYAECMKVSKHYQRENGTLKGEMSDLGRQVCFLLKEVELSRGRSFPAGDQDSPGNTSASEHSSSRIISKKLVTFGDIQELQANNQKLLKLVRDLTDKHEENERHKDQMDNGELQSKLEELTNRVTELNEAQERQIKMVNSLIRQRDMYKALCSRMKTDGHDISMNMDTSDASVDLNESNNKSMVVTPQAAFNTKELEKLEAQLAETKKHLEQQKAEFNSYKEEMIRNERMLIEQQESMHKELTTLTASYTKCVSQSEYNNDRYKILQTNVITYKKQISSLEEKNKIYSATIAKHEIALKHLRDETLNAQSNQSKSEVMLENLKRECKFLKDSECRLQAEREMLNKERQGQSLLLNNLELIKASLERNEGEGKIRLESRLDEAIRECSALRRRLQEEQDRFRELGSHLEKQTAQAKSRMEDEKNQAEKFKAELASVRGELTKKANHIEELSKKLADAINPMKIDGNFDSSKRLKELENQLAQRQSEIHALNRQLEVSKEHIQQYCDISEGAERELKAITDEYTQYKSATEVKLNSALQSQEQLKEKCSELDAELSLQTDGQSVTTSSLKKELLKAQEDLKTALSNLNDKSTDLDEARVKISKLSEDFQSAEDKYANEVVLHSKDIQALTSLKEQLSKLNQTIDELTSAKELAVDSLKESEMAWKKHESMLNVEKEDMNSRITDLNKQNSLLLDQIQALGTQLAVAHSSKHSESMNESSVGVDVSMNRSLNEDDVKSSDQLLQIIKYLRKECDIIVAKFDIMQAENSRIKSQLEVTEKKLDEAKMALMSEREKSEITSVTLTKHSDILRKVETLNAITDSNRILREERDSLLNKVNDLSVTSKRLEETLSPLQEKNREISTRVDALQSENVSLKAEAGRWRTRVNALMERANKTKPEDWKRLQNERETLAKMLTTEKDNMKKMQEEATHMRLEKIKLQEQINNLTKQHLSHVEEFKKQTEEMTTLKADISRVTQELGEAKSATNAKSAEINKVTENLTANEAVLADIRNKEMQIRKIAKKYKSQYEDLVKTVEEDKKKLEVSANAVAVSSAEEKKTTEKKIEEMERAHAEQSDQLTSRINSLLEETASLQKEVESMRKSNSDNEEQAKEVMKQAKMRIVKLQEANTALNKELEDSKTQLKTFEQNIEENDSRYGLLKSQYDARFARLEKDKTESLQEKQQDTVRLNREIESLLQKVNQLQRQLTSQQTAKPSTSSGQGDKVVSEPPTANIKPMTGVGSQQSVGGRRPGGETPFASIRPMASHTTPRTAAVLPTSAQTPSPAHPAPATLVSHHQTPHTTGSVSGDVLSALPSSSHHTTEYMPASSSAVGVRHHTHHARHPAPTPPESTQDMEAEVRAVEVASGNIPLVSPQTLTTTQTASASVLPTTQQAVALVMPRMEPPAVVAHAHSDTQAAQHAHHPHHAHAHQQQASSSSGSNSSSSTVTTSHVPGASADNTGTEAEAHRAHKRPRAPPDHPQKPTTNKRSRIQGFEGVSESDVEYQVPTSSQRDQEDEGVIVVDSDEENQYAEQYQDGIYSRMEIGEEEIDEEESDDDEAEGEEEEESGEGGEEEEGEGEGEGDGEEGEEGEGEGGENEIEEREVSGDNNEVDLVEETSRDMPAQSIGEGDVGGSGDVASASGSENVQQLSSQREEQNESAAPSLSPSPSPVLQSQRQQIQTITSGSQGGSNSLMLSGVGSGVGSGVSGVYEEGDDGIVPSTPTLYVPRRNNDGFGEAVSSPVPGGSTGSTGGRFLFGDGGGSGSGSGGGGGGGEMESTHADLTAQLAPHQPSANTTQGEVPSITVTEPCGESELDASSGAAVSSEAEAGSIEPSAADEDTPTVSSQGSQPASPQQMEEGREAEASASPSVNTRSHSAQETPQRGLGRGNTPNRHMTRSLHRPSPHHRRPTPITWAEGDNRNNPFMQRGGMQQRGQRSRRPQPPFMRF